MEIMSFLLGRKSITQSLSSSDIFSSKLSIKMISLFYVAVYKKDIMQISLKNIT